MRYLGIDYGLKRLGLAMCDPKQTIVSPLCRLHHDPGQPQRCIGAIKELVEEHGVEALVLGLPLNMDGSEGTQAKQTRQFGEQIGRVIDVPVHFQDERLSSAAADDLMDQMDLNPRQRKEKRDMLAACAILQDFLDATASPNHDRPQ